MAKRIKRVFSSHSQVTHVWAQQKQDSGRGANIFFENTTKLYSYGYHYLMAQVHTAKGKRFALVNEYRYSSSTSQHLGYTRSALDGLMPYFEVSDPSDLSKAVKDLDRGIQLAIDSALKRKFFADSRWNDSGCKDEIERHLKSIRSAWMTANQLRKILGRVELKFPHDKNLAVIKHLKKLEDRYNSPERQKKRADKAEAEKEARKQRETRQKEVAETAKQKSAEALEAFRAGKAFNQYAIETEFDLVRVRGTRVETSRGAVVPLKVALELLQVSASDPFALSGKGVGEFTIDNVAAYDTKNGSDYLLEVGCHRILLSEARRAIMAPPSMVLVQGGVPNG